MKKIQVQKVIDTFEKVLKEYPQAKLDMEQGCVNNPFHICGTVHCHGGFYAIGACDLENHPIYIHGADQMAKDLGLEDNQELERWANDHPKEWGNEKGRYMFINETSFKSSTRPNGAKSLKDIIQHWREVKERLID